MGVPVGLLDRVRAVLDGNPAVEQRYDFSDWANDALGAYVSRLVGGNLLPTTYGTAKAAEITSTLPGYAEAIKGCPPAFAAQLVRALILSQARFTWRRLPSQSNPRKLFGTQALAPLESPWAGATTGELISRMEWHAGLAGNAFVHRDRERDRLRLLRPDWTALLYASTEAPQYAGWALDSELIGYGYQLGGWGTGGPIEFLFPEEVAHWSPLPDPISPGIGMSWLTPAIRDMQGDRLTAEHKIKYFELGATPNLVVKGLAAANREEFDELVDMMESRHAGVSNAYRTLYLTAGADATVIGSNMQQMDFKSTQGTGETRISFLSRVPAPILGIAEGLAGSSLNAGNFGSARRTLADTWAYPTLADLAGCLSTILDVPPGAELWFDPADIGLLREDAKDAAEIESVKAQTIRQYVEAGFTPESAVAAVVGQNPTLLVHTGLVSVQLNPPGTTSPTPALPAGK